MASHPDRNMLFFVTPLICGLAASIFFLLKHQKTSSSSSSTATCPPSSDSPSSSSVDSPEIKSDVFVSFRGTDTGSGFFSHLLDALDREKIHCFYGEKNIEKGDEISPTLLDAIKKSEISLVLFSEDYAYSRWCLEELEQILHCRENQNQIVVPIFYKVDPSTVRHQKESYNKAFDELGKRFDEPRLQKWRTALRKAADLSGFPSSNCKTEATLVREIVERVLAELTERGNQTDLKGFVGIHEHIQYLETRLREESQDILTIGIWGMAGVGKTTIAEILYNRLCNKYEASCLLCVREKLEESISIGVSKKDPLSKRLGKVVHYVIHMGGVDAEYVDSTLQGKKVLVVLDDINDWGLPEIISGTFTWFGPGSRIIMTSRDKNVFPKGRHEIYEVNRLNSKYALELFEKCFEKSFIEKQELSELSKCVVNYAEGIPLVIKVLCGYFSGVKSKEEQKSKLEKLKKIPDPKIQKVLELGYYGLDDERHKTIFLYLACFFQRESIEWITSLLDNHNCDYYAIDSLKALQDKALLTISEDGFVYMHDLIRVMGREIVRKTSLGQRSHVWDFADIYDVFENEKGTRPIESIRLETGRLEKVVKLGPQAFAGMKNLRLLQVDCISACGYLDPPEEGFESFPKALRCLIWARYPSRSLMSRFCNENLVELHLRDSGLQRLWSGCQDLPNLEVIDLEDSGKLIEVPDLSKAPKLRRLKLQGCDKLRYFGLWPNHNIVELDPTEYEERRKISIEESKEDDHLDLCGTSSPIKPSYKYYVFLSLQFLSLPPRDCSTDLPDDIALCLPSLQKLILFNTYVKTIPASIKHLSHLKELIVSWSWQLRYIPELPPSIEFIETDHCSSLETIEFASNSMPLSHKHRLILELECCCKLDDHALRSIAWYFKFTIQRMISASIKDGYAYLRFSRSKIPELFDNRCYRVTQDSRSLALVLPLHSEVMGFIFFAFCEGPDRVGIKCHIAYLSDIELRSHVPVLKGHVQFTYYCQYKRDSSYLDGSVCFWYESSLYFKIMEELSTVKVSAATTDDLCALVWFELLDDEWVEEWAVYSDCAMGFYDVRFL